MRYTLYYFLKYKQNKEKVSYKGWKGNFLNVIRETKSLKIPKIFEIPPKASCRRIITHQKNLCEILILHRKNGPAIEFSDGKKEYYLNGELHRVEGPAKASKYLKEYYLYGNIH